MSDFLTKMLINVEDDETRIAIVRNGTLDNLYIDHTHRAQTVGNIYSGVVVKVQSSFQAAFVDYGAERHGFLAASDLNPMLFKFPKGVRGRPAINQLLRPGQNVMVQVVKDEIAHKGAALTTNVALPGRFLVFMPNSDKGGVSRRIEDAEQRSRLKHLLKGLGSEDASAIIRTAGVDRSLTELKQDFMSLRRTWNKIKTQFDASRKPGLLHREEDAVVRMLRDYFTDDIEDIVIDDPEAFQRALEFFQANMPGRQKRLSLYLGERPLLSENDIEDQIEWLNNPQVPLPSGGSLVIQPTEALVSIDVNSGKSNQEKNIEETALRSNLEAAEEVARQLRLRNLGGLVVIDFIDMSNAQNRQAVVQRLAEAMETDKARWTLGEISQFGLLEMSRQRIASSLTQSWKETCPSCHGSGKVLSSPSLVNKLLRQIRDSVVRGRYQEVRVRLPLGLAEVLLNKKRKQVHQIESEYAVRINVHLDPTLGEAEIPDIEYEGRDGYQTSESFYSDPNEVYRNRDFRSRAARELRAPVDETPDVPTRNPLVEDTDTTEDELDQELDETEENNTTETNEEDGPRYRKSRSRGRGRGRRGRRNRGDNHQEEDWETNESEEPETKAAPPKPETSEEATPPLLVKGKTLYNSVHEKSDKEDNTPWTPKQISPWRRKLRMLPPNTTVFSSVHVDAQGNIIQHLSPVSGLALGNAFPVEAPEEVSTHLVSTDSSQSHGEETESSATTPLSSDSNRPDDPRSSTANSLAESADSADAPTSETVSESNNASTTDSDSDSTSWQPSDEAPETAASPDPADAAAPAEPQPVAQQEPVAAATKPLMNVEAPAETTATAPAAGDENNLAVPAAKAATTPQEEEATGDTEEEKEASSSKPKRAAASRRSTRGRGRGRGRGTADADTETSATAHSEDSSLETSAESTPSLVAGSGDPSPVVNDGEAPSPSV
jgi:ribonuclease E